MARLYLEMPRLALSVSRSPCGRRPDGLRGSSRSIYSYMHIRQLCQVYMYYIYIYMYVYMYIYIYVYVYTYIYIYTYIHTYTYIYIYIYIYMYMCIHIYIYIYREREIHIHMYTYTHVYIHTYTYTRLCTEAARPRVRARCEARRRRRRAPVVSSASEVSKTRKCTSKGIRRQGLVSKHRNSLQKSLCQAYALSSYALILSSSDKTRPAPQRPPKLIVGYSNL